MKIQKKICRSKLDGADKLTIQKLQQEYDKKMNSKAKVTTFEIEVVRKL